MLPLLPAQPPPSAVPGGGGVMCYVWCGPVRTYDAGQTMPRGRSLLAVCTVGQEPHPCQPGSSRPRRGANLAHYNGLPRCRSTGSGGSGGGVSWSRHPAAVQYVEVPTALHPPRPSQPHAISEPCGSLQKPRVCPRVGARDELERRTRRVPHLVRSRQAMATAASIEQRRHPSRSPRMRRTETSGGHL